MIDLHFHSNYSDGKMNIKELANALISAGIETASLTDHDTIEGIIPLRNLVSPREINLINGVELTALFKGKEIHVLVYGFDITEMQTFIAKKNEITNQNRNSEFETACRLAKANGFKLSNNLCPERGKPIGLTLAKDVLQNNNDLLETRHQKILTTDDFFHLYQAFGKTCYVERAGVGVNWILDELKDISKNIFIAHPFVAPSIAMKPLSEDEILELIKFGFTGIEIYHNNTTDKQIKTLLRIVRTKNLMYSGGSDFHGRITDTPLGHYNKGKIVPRYMINL